jgi:hypothetical protein
MKKWAILTAGAALLMATIPVFAKPSAPAGNSNVGHIFLYEKEPVNWTIVHPGAFGRLKYEMSGPKFCYVFNGHGLEPDIEYSLIYYADPWPGNHPGALIDSGIPNNGGNIHLAGCIDLGMDLPHPDDANYESVCGDPNTPGNPPTPYPCGAKIWLVTSDDYDADNTIMDGWHPAEYLFEDATISYDDTEV